MGGVMSFWVFGVVVIIQKIINGGRKEEGAARRGLQKEVPTWAYNYINILGAIRYQINK